MDISITTPAGHKLRVYETGDSNITRVDFEPKNSFGFYNRNLLVVATLLYKYAVECGIEFPPIGELIGSIEYRISIYIGPGWNIAKVLKRDLPSVFVLLGRYLRKEGIEIEGIEK